MVWALRGRLSVVSAIGVALVVAACSGRSDPEVLNSPYYKLGYSDGCRTSHTRLAGIEETVHKNDTLYKAESAYRDGWGDGYSNCGGDTSIDRRDIFADDNYWLPGYDFSR